MSAMKRQVASAKLSLVIRCVSQEFASYKCQQQLVRLVLATLPDFGKKAICCSPGTPSIAWRELCNQNRCQSWRYCSGQTRQQKVTSPRVCNCTTRKPASCT